MAIHIVTGKPRAGKSYFMVSRIIKDIKKGIPCYLNFKVDLTKYPFTAKEIKAGLGSIYYWKNVKDFINIPEGHIYVDEAYTLFGSKDWQKLPMEVMSKFLTHGHYSIDIWACSQSQKRINNTIREVVNYAYRVKSLKLPFLPRFFITQVLDPDELMSDKVKPEVWDRYYYFFKQSIANCYDTLDKSFVTFEIDQDYQFECLFNGKSAGNLAGDKI